MNRPVPDEAGRWTVGWGFHAACNLSCPFCYSARVRREAPRTAGAELDRAAEFLRRNGPQIRALNFGTGESFLSPAFPDLLDLCSELAPGAGIAVTTNGFLARLPGARLRRVCRRLAECDVSLDFVSEEAHDGWRGERGTWRSAVESVRLATESGCTTSLVMVGTEQTLAEDNLGGLMALARTLGAALRVNLYMPTSGDFSFAPSVNTVCRAIHLLSRSSSGLLCSDRLLGTLLGHAPARERHGSCRILPGGALTPSTYLMERPWIAGELHDRVELSALAGEAPFRLYADPPLPRACERCDHRDACRGGSVERRWFWGRSLDVPDPLCPVLSGDPSMELLCEVRDRGTPEWRGPTIHLDYLPTLVATPCR